MATAWSNTLRHALRKSESCVLRKTQRRWAQVHDVRFLTTNPSTDRAFEKYREKLDRKAKQLGVKDINELRQVYEDKIKEAQKPDPATTQIPFHPPPPPQPAQSSPTNPSQASQPSPISSKPAIKTLSSFLDLEKTLSLPSKEIEALWRLRHANSPSTLCAAMPKSTYLKMAATAREHPQFILPLPREGQGSEIHFLQWTFPSPDSATVLFTNLAEYKLRGEYAAPHTTVTHHLEMAEEKGLVLLQGTVVDGRGVTVEEARWLLLCLQKFYGMQEREERRELLKLFSSGDQRFRIENLMEEAERID